MTGSMPKDVVVIVVTWNSADVLSAFLRSLPAALEGVRDWGLVVVANDSADDTLGVVRRTAPWASIVQTGRNAGYAAAINAGVASAAPSPAVLICNPDLRLSPGSVSRLVEALAVPGTGIAVPRLEDESGGLQPSLRREPTVRRALGEALLGGARAGRFAPLGEMVTDPRCYAEATTADWASGAAMLVSRHCLESVGPWDESFFLYSEETDFALRARDAGFALRYVPGAVAVHIGGESGVSPRLWGILTRNRVELFRKRHGRVHTAAFRGAVALNEGVRAARSATHRAGLRALLPRGRTTLTGSPPPGYICFSAQDFWYHNRAHSDIQLMRHVAADRTVLFVNSIGLRMPVPGRSSQPFRRIARKLRSVAKLVRRPLPGQPNFHVMTPLIVPLYSSRLARAVNAWMVRFQVRVVARVIGIRRAAIVVTIPTAWDVVRDMPRHSLLVNRSDRHSSFPEADRALIEGMEHQLLRHADHVLYVSQAFQSDESPLTNGRAFFLDHGVDLDHFTPRPPETEPEDLATIPHPRIGFFGSLDDYLVDFDLLERVAREVPEAHLVLIGDATCSMRRFDGLANVHWLGFRPYDEIPAYGSGFDVALMPWLQNDWIQSCNPIKLKEYLALGLPVVSIDFPEVRRYGDSITIAADADSFVAAVRAALFGGDPLTPGDRRAAVAHASWQGRAKDLVALAERTPIPAGSGR
jgi:GT2 family glycosyltransferase